MDCRKLQDRLEALLEGTLREDERPAVEEHLRGCLECSELVGLARATADPVDEAPPSGFAEGVLARTSGSACSRAADLLGDHADGALRGDDRQLLELHLRDCADCAALIPVLHAMSRELPTLAELPPDEGLAGAVLARTSLAPVLAQVDAELHTLAEVWPDRDFVSDVMRRTIPARRRWSRQLEKLSEAWVRIARRPRFAMEGACLATFVLVLIFATPGSPLAGVPKAALGVARSVPNGEEIRAQRLAMEAEISLSMRSAWLATGGKVLPIPPDSKLAMFYDDLTEDWRTFKQRFASKTENDDEARPEEEGDGSHGDKT